VRRRALVTGGSGAIGAAICRALAAGGCEVIVHGNSHADAARALASEIGGQAVAFDVTDAAAARAALEALVEHEAVQIVVNNAGIHDDAAFPGMSAEQWRRVIDVSLNGFFNVTQPLVMPMVRTRWGRIVSITSVAADLGNRGQANYAAAKGALHAASRTLARELGSRGITVNCVSPGLVDTTRTGASASAAPAHHAHAHTLLGRRGRPEEIASAVVWFASPGARYTTGQTLHVNGGAFLGG
jgi:3-oxoacyl-[acyl-carrier protein] reductase